MRMLAINLFHFPHCLACMLVCLLVVSGWSEGRGVSPYNIIKKTMKVHTPILHYLSSMMLLGGAQVSDERSICVESIQIAKKKKKMIKLVYMYLLYLLTAAPHVHVLGDLQRLDLAPVRIDFDILSHIAHKDRARACTCGMGCR